MNEQVGKMTITIRLDPRPLSERTPPPPMLGIDHVVRTPDGATVQIIERAEGNTWRCSDGRCWDADGLQHEPDPGRFARCLNERFQREDLIRDARAAGLFD